MKLYVAVLLSKIIYSGQDVSTHSLVTARIVSRRGNEEFLWVMEQFGDIVKRDHRYLPRSLAVNKPSKTKAWRLCENISMLSSQPHSYVDLPQSFRDRVRRAFDWFYTEHLPKSDPQAQAAKDLVRRHLELLDIPKDLGLDSEEGAVAEIAQMFKDLMEGGDNRESPIGHRVIFDRGDRMYHAGTKLKKEVRRQCTLGGEPVVEVDMHASFVVMLTSLYATGEERERLIEMLQSGDFYGSFADLAEFPAEGMKEQFLRDVVFSYRRAGNALWDAFYHHFPNTARELSRDRDRGKVVKEKRKRNINGHPYTCRTREGQRYLFRRLSMTESRIFWRGAMIRLWDDYQIPAIPIHDGLLVRESDAEAALETILECSEEVLGFRPMVKLKDGKIIAGSGDQDRPPPPGANPTTRSPRGGLD